VVQVLKRKHDGSQKRWARKAKHFLKRSLPTVDRRVKEGNFQAIKSDGSKGKAVWGGGCCPMRAKAKRAEVAT